MSRTHWTLTTLKTQMTLKEHSKSLRDFFQKSRALFVVAAFICASLRLQRPTVP
jgi:hypothetical protein